MAAALADDPGHRVLGAAEPLHQQGIGIGLFQRVQVRTLDILDDGDFQHLEIVHRPVENRHLGQPGQLGRAPAPLAGDDLPHPVLAGLGPHQNGQQHPLVADRGGQFVQLGRVELFTGLVGIGLQALDRHHQDAARGDPATDGNAFADLFTQQGRQSAPQASLTF